MSPKIPDVGIIRTGTMCIFSAVNGTTAAQHHLFSTLQRYSFTVQQPNFCVLLFMKIQKNNCKEKPLSSTILCKIKMKGV